MEQKIFDNIVDELIESGQIIEEKGLIRSSSQELKLSEKQKNLVADIEKIFIDSKFKTPRLDELSDILGKDEDEIQKLINILFEKEILIKLENKVILHKESVEEAKAMVRTEIERDGKLISSEFRDKLNTSRKYVIPLLEHLDQIGLTIRVGNERFLRKKR